MGSRRKRKETVMKTSLMIPKKLVEEKPYSNMTQEARILYVTLLHLKENMFREKNWVDSRGFRYVIAPKKDLQKAFGYSRYMLDKYMRELEVMGLIRYEFVRTPVFERRIYVRSFDPLPDDINIGWVEYIEDSDPGETGDPKQEEGENKATVDPDGEHVERRKEKASGNKQEEKQKTASLPEYPLCEEEAARLTLRNIRLMTCILEEMIGEMYESKR